MKSISVLTVTNLYNDFYVFDVNLFQKVSSTFLRNLSKRCYFNIRNQVLLFYNITATIDNLFIGN